MKILVNLNFAHDGINYYQGDLVEMDQSTIDHLLNYDDLILKINSESEGTPLATTRTEKDLKKMKKAELLDFAKFIQGCEVNEEMTIAQIIETMKQREGVFQNE